MIRVVVSIDESRQHVEIKTDKNRHSTKTEIGLAGKMEDMLAAMMKAAIETTGGGSAK